MRLNIIRPFLYSTLVMALALATLCLNAPATLAASEAPPGNSPGISSSQALKVAESLRMKMGKIGPFKAQYHAVKPGAAPVEIMVLNIPGEFIHIRISGFPDTAGPTSTIYRREADDYWYYLIDEKPGTAQVINSSSLFDPVKNPAMIFVLASDLVSAEDSGDTSALNSAPETLQPGKISLNLGLSSNSLNTGIGFLATGPALQASWLTPEQLNIASGFELSEGGDLTVLLGPDHQLTIDAATGLLLNDSIITTEGIKKELRLVSIKPMEADTQVQEHLPGFDTLKLTPLAEGKPDLLAAILASTLASAADSLADIEELRSRLKQTSGSISAISEKVALAYWTDRLRQMPLSEQQADRLVTTSLLPLYREMKAIDPATDYASAMRSMSQSDTARERLMLNMDEELFNLATGHLVNSLHLVERTKAEILIEVYKVFGFAYIQGFMRACQPTIVEHAIKHRGRFFKSSRQAGDTG